MTSDTPALLIGRKVRELRGARRQADVAAAAGIDQGHWSKIERGAILPGLPVLANVAKALDTPLTTFSDLLDACEMVA